MYIVNIFFILIVVSVICLLLDTEARGGRGGGGRGGGGRGGSSRGSSGRSRGSSSSSGGGKGWSLFGTKSSASSSITSSSRFRSFAAGAGVGYLAGKSSGPKYYFVPRGYYYDSSFKGDDNVCYADVDVTQLSTGTPKNNITVDSSGQTRVYFLCDGSCCGTDCCELNVGFLIFLIIVGVVVLFCCCGCCYYCCEKDDSSNSDSTSVKLDQWSAHNDYKAGTNTSTTPAYPCASYTTYSQTRGNSRTKLGFEGAY